MTTPNDAGRDFGTSDCSSSDWEYEQFVQPMEYDVDNDCPRCQGSGEVPTADYESYFGQNYKPCPMCGGNGDR